MRFLGLSREPKVEPLKSQEVQSHTPKQTQAIHDEAGQPVEHDSRLPVRVLMSLVSIAMLWCVKAPVALIWSCLPNPATMLMAEQHLDELQLGLPPGL